jgi:hypothetical protein
MIASDVPVGIGLSMDATIFILFRFVTRLYLELASVAEEVPPPEETTSGSGAPETMSLVTGFTSIASCCVAEAF